MSDWPTNWPFPRAIIFEGITITAGTKIIAPPGDYRHMRAGDIVAVVGVAEDALFTEHGVVLVSQLTKESILP